METKSYRVVLLGIDCDKDPLLVKQQLVRTFRTSPEQIEKLFSKLPVTVKSHADYQTAKKYHDAILGAGCICSMEADEEVIPLKPPSRESPHAIRTCPNCGYNATTPEDPLLTAYDGNGECPACGIIVSKFTRSRESLTSGSSPVPEEAEKTPTMIKNVMSSILSRPWISLIVVAAVAVLAINLFFRESPKNEGTDVLKSAESGQGQSAASDAKAPAGVSVFKVLPGETKDVTLTMYLDILHRDSFSPLTITPGHKIDNQWEQEGVRVEIRNVKVTPVSVSLWEQLREKDDVWVPASYGKISSQGGSLGMVEKGKNLLVAQSPAALVKKPDVTSVKIDPANPNFRKSAYTMYRLDYDLSISVPSGQEFGGRELTFTTKEGKTVPQVARQKNACIKTNVQLENDSSAEALMPSFASGQGQWKATKITLFGFRVNCIAMEHASRREGLYLSPGDKFCELPGYCELEML